MNDTILQIQHLSKSFGSHEVLKDIDFSVKKGDVTSIIGASGSGKSTLLRCINLLENPSSGEIYYHEQNILRRGFNVPTYRSRVGMVLFFFIVGLLIAVLVPQLMESVVMLVKNIQDFASNLEVYIAELTRVLQQEYHLDPALYESLTKTGEDILGLGSALLLSGFQRLLGLTGQLTTWVLDFFVALIVSVYLLMSKEHFFAQWRKLLYAFLKKETVEKMLYVGRLTGNTFHGFINGKLIDSLIIGILAFICLTIMDMPYVLLVSVIIGVTNIIPFFGPFIGAIPSTFIILIVNPVQALWFVVFILILQQIDGNIIGPKILGSSTGLPAIWVMFAILVGGGLAGFVGMIAGVPAMAVIYTLFKNYVKQRLEQKALPSNTEDYLSSEMDPYQAKGAVNHASESAGSDS